jgi:hypothetical protein
MGCNSTNFKIDQDRTLNGGENSIKLNKIENWTGQNRTLNGGWNSLNFKIEQDRTLNGGEIQQNWIKLKIEQDRTLNGGEIQQNSKLNRTEHWTGMKFNKF